MHVIAITAAERQKYVFEKTNAVFVLKLFMCHKRIFESSPAESERQAVRSRNLFRCHWLLNERENFLIAHDRKAMLGYSSFRRLKRENLSVITTLASYLDHDPFRHKMRPQKSK